MKKLFMFLALGLLVANTAFAQADKGDFYISGTTGGIFPLQSNNSSFSDRLLFGLEGNYFVANGVSITGGLDYLLGGEQTMAVFGTRLYPGGGNFYFRHKAMVNVKSRFSNDFMLGVGKHFPLNDTFSVETNCDYHFTYQAIGIKVGLTLTL